MSHFQVLQRSKEILKFFESPEIWQPAEQHIVAQPPIESDRFLQAFHYFMILCAPMMESFNPLITGNAWSCYQLLEAEWRIHAS